MTEREAAAAARNGAPPDEDRSNDDDDDDADAGGGSDDGNNAPSPSSCSPPPSSVPKDTRDYSRIEYWDRRFESEEEYEWCGRFEDFRGLLVAALEGKKRVLVLGSGTSRLPFDLAAEKEALLPELEEVVATDLSAVAVEKMAARTLREEEEREEEREGNDGDDSVGDEETAKKEKRKSKRARITWQVADMLCLPFPDASFDAVIDKGVLDALFAGFGSPGGGGGGSAGGGEKEQRRFDKWRPRETAPLLWDSAQKALRESHRVLNPSGGCYVQVSFEQPHFRRPFLDAPGLSWGGSETAFGEEGGLQFFFYQRRRGEGALASSEAAASEILPSGYEPDESPMHDHMDEEDFLMRTSL